ncbi:hypothetical protein ACE38W_01975 [Chitinophaga sp. Hz27]|uniref:hypothetical protein n=1 Tax=Chitinophaga sp. Hz27 TaxID=3347169 RepID=UPI0035DBB2ED
MKYILLALVMLSLYACNTLPQRKVVALPPHTRKVELQLKDSLGTLELAIPERYDTAFEWIWYSDCKPCDHQEYRFQPKGLPIDQESGWIWSHHREDSVDRLTISHGRVVDPPFDGAGDIVGYHRNHKEGIIASGKTLLLDTIQRIQDREISIFVYKPWIYNACTFNKIVAYTMVRHYEVELNFELTTKMTDTLHQHFIDRTMALIQHIHMKK